MKHLITFAFLLVAIIFGVVGSATGFVIFIVAGLVLEGVFWFRIFKK